MGYQPGAFTVDGADYDIVTQAMLDERTYVSAERADIASQGTLNIAIQNPAASDYHLLFYYGQITVEGDANVTVYDSVTNPGSLTAGLVNNNFMGSDRETTANVYLNISYDSGNIHQETTYRSPGSYTFFDGYKLVVPPDEYVMVEITDQSQSDNEGAVRMAFAEI